MPVGVPCGCGEMRPPAHSFQVLFASVFLFRVIACIPCSVLAVGHTELFIRIYFNHSKAAPFFPVNNQ